MNSLWNLFCRGRGRCRSRINVIFLDTFPPHILDELPPGYPPSGHFEPETSNEPEYNVRVLDRPDSGPRSRRLFSHESWPDPSVPPYTIRFTHSDPTSQMATTLYHELLHVWFVNARPRSTYPTGHGAVELGQFEDEFFRHLQDFTAQIDEVESRIHAEARAVPERETSLESPAELPPTTEATSRKKKRNPFPSG